MPFDTVDIVSVNLPSGIDWIGLIYGSKTFNASTVVLLTLFDGCHDFWCTKVPNCNHVIDTARNEFTAVMIEVDRHHRISMTRFTMKIRNTHKRFDIP